MNYSFIIFPSDIFSFYSNFNSNSLNNKSTSLSQYNFDTFNIPLNILSSLKLFISYEILDFVKISYPVSISIHDITSSNYIFFNFCSVLKNVPSLSLSQQDVLTLYKNIFIYSLFYFLSYSILSFFIFKNNIFISLSSLP
ncbi:hypothetical protein V6O07_22640 [Arthrospira platensis SPKY2]